MGTEEDSVASVANLEQVENIVLWPPTMLIRRQEGGRQVKGRIIDSFQMRQMASVVGSRVGIHKPVARLALAQQLTELFFDDTGAHELGQSLKNFPCRREWALWVVVVDMGWAQEAVIKGTA